MAETDLRSGFAYDQPPGTPPGMMTIRKHLAPAFTSRRAVVVLSMLALTLSVQPGQALASIHERDIAFSSLRGTQQDIYAMRSDGKGVRNLTDDTHPDFQPAWSPNGATIAFTSLHVAQSHFDQIYTMDARGKHRVRLTDLAKGNAQEPTWSPDGQAIAFSVSYGGAIDDEIFVVNADGSNLVRLTNNSAADSDPAWSPDGSRIAFVRDASIRLMDPDGRNVQRITPDAMLAFDPAWSPDGRRIAFTGWPANGGEADLYVMRPDGSNMRLVRATTATESDPSWSPDGRRIVYVQTRIRGDDDIELNVLCTIGANGKGRRILSSDPLLSDNFPDWRHVSGS